MADGAAWQVGDDGITIAVRVTPRSSREAIAGKGDRFAVRLNAPPVDGAANAALIVFLAKRFGVARRAVTILGGETARQKRLRIEGDPETLATTARSLYGAGA
ncbi:DUF167 domain-containing protein [Stakelama marina]|uniref:UPF0235 protein J7S20_08075 n=1 Tax=Stakelama marina TaxID=2826939 RepID=A0A8T4IBR1_9SPHN|nr:DUF167 domain-containing protein [Stakelama marina]MBR0552458.1 YggU family protein [Stakelama marina]